MDMPCLSHPKVCFIVKVCLHWVCTVPICLELFKPVDSRRRLRALPLGQSGGVSLLSHCNEHHHQRGETTKCVHQFPRCLFVSVVDAIHTLLLWGYTRSHHVIYYVIPASSWWELLRLEMVACRVSRQEVTHAYERTPASSTVGDVVDGQSWATRGSTCGSSMSQGNHLPSRLNNVEHVES